MLHAEGLPALARRALPPSPKRGSWVKAESLGAPSVSYVVNPLVLGLVLPLPGWRGARISGGGMG